MKRIELKIPIEGSKSNEPTTCLMFSYLQHTWDFKTAPSSVELGLRIMRPLAEELRRKDYEVSDPAGDKKGFGTTGMHCRVGKERLFLALWPPRDGDQWRMVTGWGPKRKSWRETTELEGYRKSVYEIVENVVAGMDGIRELRWMSFKEAERELRSRSIQ